MKNAPWVIALFLALIVGFASGLYVQQKAAILTPKEITVTDGYSLDVVLGLVEAAAADGYMNGAKGCFRGDFTSVEDDAYKAGVKQQKAQISVLTEYSLTK